MRDAITDRLWFPSSYHLDSHCLRKSKTAVGAACVEGRLIIVPLGKKIH